MVLRCLEKSNIDAVLGIAQSLPQWFTEGGVELIRKDIFFQAGIIRIENRVPIKFITSFVNQGVATIGWMGVRPENQRGGVGKAIVEHLKECLIRSNVTQILVSTLG